MKKHKDCKFYYFEGISAPKQGRCIAHPPAKADYPNVIGEQVACGEFEPKEEEDAESEADVQGKDADDA